MKVCPNCAELFPDTDAFCKRCAPVTTPVIHPADSLKYSEPESPRASRLASVWKWVTLVSVVVTLWKGASNIYFGTTAWPSSPPPYVEPSTKAAGSSSWQLRYALHDDSVLPDFKSLAPLTDFASSVYVNVEWEKSGAGVSWVVFSRDWLIMMRNSSIENPETGTPSPSMKVCVPADEDGLCQYKYSAVPVVRNPVLDLAVLKISWTYEEMSHSRFANYHSVTQIAGKKLAYSAYSSVWITSAHRWFSETSSILSNGDVKTSVFYFPWAEWGAVYDGSWSVAGIFTTLRPADRELSFTPSSKIVDWLQSVTGKRPDSGYSKSDFSVKKAVAWTVWGSDSTLTPEYLAAHSVLDDQAAAPDKVVSAGKFVLSVRPKYATANFRVWTAYVALWKPAESLPYLWTAASLSPGNYDYLLEYAKALSSAWEYQKTVSVCESAYALQNASNPVLSEFSEIAAMAYDKLWKVDDRNLALAKAATLDAGNASAMEAYSKFVLSGKLASSEEQNRLCVEKLWAKAVFTGRYLANWQPNCGCVDWASVYSGKCKTSADLAAESNMVVLERVETYKRLHFANRDPNVLSADPDALRRDMDDIKKYAWEDVYSSAFVNNRLLTEVRKFYVPNLRASPR